MVTQTAPSISAEIPVPPNPYRDTEFGAKLDAIEGLIGFRYEANKFERTTLSRIMQINESQVKRKRDGKEPISYHHLSKLIAHFELESQLDYQAFFLPLPAFKEALKLARVGTHAGDLANLARQQLYMMARPGQPKTADRCSIEIIETQQSRRGGGLGYSQDVESKVSEFSYGDQARLRIKTPRSPGHLVVFNDSMDLVITCLMPSCLAPNTAAKGGTIEVPDREEYPPFKITSPSGFYRLLAVWTSEKPMLPWVSGDPAADKATKDISGQDFSTFVDHLNRLTEGECPPAVATADYRVLSR